MKKKPQNRRDRPVAISLDVMPWQVGGYCLGKTPQSSKVWFVSFASAFTLFLLLVCLALFYAMMKCNACVCNWPLLCSALASAVALPLTLALALALALAFCSVCSPLYLQLKCFSPFRGCNFIFLRGAPKSSPGPPKSGPGALKIKPGGSKIRAKRLQNRAWRLSNRP